MTEFLKYHLSDFSSKTDLTIRILVRNNKIDLVKYFLTLPNVDAILQCQLSLVWSIGQNHINMLKYLLQFLADNDADTSNRFFCESICICIYDNNHEMLKFFLERFDVKDYVMEKYKNLKKDIRFDNYNIYQLKDL